MQAKPDGKFKYIFHMVDHFSKYHVLAPQKSKEAKETVEMIVTEVFSYFRLPKIIHSGNGKEFINDIIHAIVVLWPGRLSFINSGPRHSQSQGLVEQGSNTIETMRCAREKDEQYGCWSKWLPEIQCKN